MRSIEPQLQASLSGGATRLCRCWLITRRDALQIGFTDHDQDLTLEGILFRASSGLDAAALQTGTGLSVG